MAQVVEWEGRQQVVAWGAREGRQRGRAGHGSDAGGRCLAARLAER